MFCPNCGTQIDENALFCGVCGTKLSANEQPQYEQPQYEQPQYEQPVYPQAPKKNNIALFIAIGAVAVVAVVAIVLLLVLGGGGSGSAKGAVELYMDVVTGDFEKLENMAPKAVWNYLEDEEDITIKEMKSEMKESLSLLSEMKITYKVGDSEKLDKDLTEDIAEELADIYDLDENSIKEARTFEVEITAKVLGESMTESEEVTVIKVGGSWYCIDYSDYGDGDVYADFLIAS